MILVRWAAAAFATVQIITYSTEPYPPGVEAAALGLAGALAAANVVIWVLTRRDLSLPGARALSISALSVDVVVASGFVWLYAFDQVSALWAILLILPLEGAIRFALPGALATWAAATVLYFGREVWGSDRYGYPLEWNSISFRMGVALLTALVAGMMARDLLRQRAVVGGALAELSRINALRSRMVAMLAHDVRNPLTTIRGTLKTLLRHADRVDEVTRAELLAAADDQADRLERLAADLLDLARLEQGRLGLRLEDVPLAEVVARGVSYADRQRRFELRIDPELTVRASPGRLEQMIVNLVSNALQYGESPFVVEARSSTDGRVDLSFRDHGPGVPEPERASLFEPFRSERAAGSVGLGLAIVQALAEAQGGTVSYEENRPRGACFRVSLEAGAPRVSRSKPVQEPADQVPGEVRDLELGNVADPG
jgi:signal transduction histidine kinase